SENFQSTIEQSPIVVLDFWASWCPPCRAFAPIFEDAAERHPDVLFGKVNTEEQLELARSFAVRAIPTVIAFKKGMLVFSKPGSLPAPTLEKLIEKLRALNMDEVPNQSTRS
ncbi:MAG TPA: thioredoxin family protein, partial [Myxococcaceae bacterium]|nr:thioredoxin family protein [Myxococcaceae bacterium]